MFVTAARKDNYRYLWDSRKRDSFVESFYEPVFGNQRIGLCFNESGSCLLSGSEDGCIRVWNSSGQDKSVTELRVGSQDLVVNSVAMIKPNTFAYSTGSRNFSQSPLDASCSNKLGILNIPT